MLASIAYGFDVIGAVLMPQEKTHDEPPGTLISSCCGGELPSHFRDQALHCIWWELSAVTGYVGGGSGTNKILVFASRGLSYVWLDLWHLFGLLCYVRL